jgi:MFS family permease
MAYFVSPDLGTTGIAIVGGSVFAATLVGRPIGAAIFGRLADTVGRKRATVLAMSGAAVCTLLMAVLPGYHHVGIVSVVLFVVLRLVGGVFLGGEYTGANPLAMEAAPRAKRGLYSGIINTGFPLAYAAISLITLLLLVALPAGGLESPYVQWGWRIPFVVGGVLTFALVAYYHREVQESQAFTGSRADGPSVFRQLLSGRNAVAFGQIFVLMTGFWLSLQPVAASLPSVLGASGVGLSSRTVTLVLVVSYLFLAVADVGAGVLSQWLGRRRFLAWSGGVMAVLGGVLYFALVRFGPENPVWAALSSLALVLVVVSPWSVLPAYINERFPTSVRASGYGLSYSLAVIAPSFYAFYQAGLANFMPFDYTGLVLLCAGAVCILVGGLWGPETRDVELNGAYARSQRTVPHSGPALRR